MITIGQLAKYAGVTVRAVRHYHQIGLLAEPERDQSGYRVYDARAVVRLIQIHTLAEAGVPLARVEELLDAGPEEFTREIAEIDRQLRAKIKRLERNRSQIAQLAAGEQLALPDSVVGYLDRLRGLGIDERYIEMERDSWIMIAARVPHEIDSLINKKHQELDTPDMAELYRLINASLDWAPNDPRIIKIADVVERIMIHAVETGEAGVNDTDGDDDQFIDLLDATMLESSPIAARVIAILHERGWRGWTRIDQIPADRLTTSIDQELPAPMDAGDCQQSAT
jgi:DNA-binding transcriptional MerR regulator